MVPSKLTAADFEVERIAGVIMPEEKEVKAVLNTGGPTSYFASTPMYRMKQHDFVYKDLLEIAKGIKSMEQNNQNEYGWHLLKAQQKFNDQD